MIGIFGDSYAHEFDTPGWPTILSELYNEEFENFAISGSSIPYSYDLLFKKDLSKYSKVIFIATEPRRLHFIDKKTNKELLWNGRDYDGSRAVNTYKTYSSYENTDTLSSLDEKILKYQEYITAMYPDSWDCMAQAMKNDVLRSHKNILLLDIYELVHVSHLGRPTVRWWEHYQESLTMRICHLTVPQNRELAGYIKDYFDNGFDIHNILNSSNAKEYFTVPKSLEESGYIKRNEM
jgi:hypothetical protein